MHLHDEILLVSSRPNPKPMLKQRLSKPLTWGFTKIFLHLKKLGFGNFILDRVPIPQTILYECVFFLVQVTRVQIYFAPELRQGIRLLEVNMALRAFLPAFQHPLIGTCRKASSFSP